MRSRGTRKRRVTDGIAGMVSGGCSVPLTPQKIADFICLGMPARTTSSRCDRTGFPLHRRAEGRDRVALRATSVSSRFLDAAGQGASLLRPLLAFATDLRRREAAHRAQKREGRTGYGILERDGNAFRRLRHRPVRLRKAFCSEG